MISIFVCALDVPRRVSKVDDRPTELIYTSPLHMMCTALAVLNFQLGVTSYGGLLIRLSF